MSKSEHLMVFRGFFGTASANFDVCVFLCIFAFLCLGISGFLFDGAMHFNNLFEHLQRGFAFFALRIRFSPFILGELLQG